MALERPFGSKAPAQVRTHAALRNLRSAHARTTRSMQHFGTWRVIPIGRTNDREGSISREHLVLAWTSTVVGFDVAPFMPHPSVAERGQRKLFEYGHFQCPPRPRSSVRAGIHLTPRVA